MRGYYRGKVPCPSCGSTEPRLSRDGICRECEYLIKLGKGVIAEKERFSTILLSRYHLSYEFDLDDTKEDYKSSRVDRIRDYLPYLSDEDGKEFSGSKLRNSLFGFIKTLNCGIKDTNSIDFNAFMREGWEEDIVYMKTESVKSFFTFYKVLVGYVNTLCIKNFNKGKNLLIGLNNGDITMKEFENY